MNYIQFRKELTTIFIEQLSLPSDYMIGHNQHMRYDLHITDSDFKDIIDMCEQRFGIEVPVLTFILNRFGNVCDNLYQLIQNKENS